MQQYMIRGHARNGYLAFWNVTTDDGVYGDYLSENAALLDAVDADAASLVYARVPLAMTRRFA
jgi:hypothetical protein